VVRRKYVEESFEPWMVFGESRDGARCDIVEGVDGGDVAYGIEKEQAARIIRMHNRVTEALADALMLIPDEDVAYGILEKIRKL